MKGNKIADNRNNHEKNSQLNSQIRFGYSGIRTCILIFTIKSSHLFLFCIFVQTWMDYVSVCFCIGQATGKNSCQFFSSTKKKIIHIIKTAIDINKQAQTATGKKYRERRKIVSKMCISQSKWVDGNVGKQWISLITQLVLTLMTVCLWYWPNQFVSMLLVLAFSRFLCYSNSKLKCNESKWWSE